MISGVEKRPLYIKARCQTKSPVSHKNILELHKNFEHTSCELAEIPRTHRLTHPVGGGLHSRFPKTRATSRVHPKCLGDTPITQSVHTRIPETHLLYLVGGFRKTQHYLNRVQIKVLVFTQLDFKLSPRKLNPRIARLDCPLAQHIPKSLRLPNSQKFRELIQTLKFGDFGAVGVGTGIPSRTAAHREEGVFGEA